MRPTVPRRSVLVGLTTFGLLGCGCQPDVDRARVTTRGHDTRAPAPTRTPTTDADTVTLIGTLIALGRPPGILPGDVGVEQTVSLRVESAKGAEIVVGTTVVISIPLHSHVPIVSGSPIPAPELDPAYFRVGRRFRIVTTLTGDRYQAKIDENAITPLD